MCSDATSQNYAISNQNYLAVLQLEFSQNELATYAEFRKLGLTKISQHWINKPAEILWNITSGTISQVTLESLRNYVLNKDTCNYAKRKVFNFTKAFLKYLTKTHLDVRYRAFELFLERPKVSKERKNIASRIVTKEDIQHILSVIMRGDEEGEIDYDLACNFTALVLFGAYSGQRPDATIKKFTVKQFREALSTAKPVIEI